MKHGNDCSCTLCDWIYRNGPSPMDPFEHSAYQYYTAGKHKTPTLIGEYRRHYDRIKNVIDWQYKPWPSSDWKTYCSVTMEVAANTSRPNITLNILADKHLREKRYYRVERIN